MALRPAGLSRGLFPKTTQGDLVGLQAANLNGTATIGPL